MANICYYLLAIFRIMLRAGQDRVRAQPVLRGQGDGRQQVQHQPLPVRG